MSTDRMDAASSRAKKATAAAKVNWAPADEFVPRRFLSNSHLQTLVGNFRPRQYRLPEAEARLIQVDPGEAHYSGGASNEAGRKQLKAGESGPADLDPTMKTAGESYVLCHCNWQADPALRLTVVLVHGLEGSSASQYMLGNAARAWAAGCNVVRMNMRNCGGTEHLSPTLYHSGLSADVDAVMRTLVAEKGLEAIALAGYSMGGNLVLKLAGDLGEAAPGFLKAVVGVSPVIDLGVSADALHLLENRAYEWKFMRGLMRRFRRKAQLFPARYSTEGIETIRTLREFDDRITARYSGFLGADDYYYRAASARVAGRIAVPALVLHALDDPFIRMLPATRATLVANHHVTLIETVHGGHCAFLAPAKGYDGYWAEKTLLDFLLSSSGFDGQAPVEGDLKE